MPAPIIFVRHLAKLSTTVSIYLKRLLLPLTWAVQAPSRYEVDSSLPKAIRASHIVVSACDTFPIGHFPGDCILLFKMPCQWVWVMTADTKLRSTSLCIAQANFYKWKNTSCHWTYKWVQIYKTCWFEFWQPTDLTRGLGECPVLSYHTIQEAE